MSQNLIQPQVTTLSDSVAGYLRQSVANSTQKAYKADLAHFYAWGGVIPASPEIIAAYLAAHAETLAVATLTRRIASLSKAHKLGGFESPTSSEIVRMTLRGIKRTHGRPQRQVAPLSKEDMIAIVTTAPDNLMGLRDKALLLTAFCGALRSAETVALQVDDVAFTNEGAILTIRRSKTDKDGHGAKVAIPNGKGRVCPASALKDWIVQSGIKDGALFRAVDNEHVAASGLCTKTVANIVKRHAKRIGLDHTAYSSHSSRSGLCTSAAQAGIPVWKIKTQSRHASDAMLMRYVRDGDMFRDNAAALF
jgi:integrase